MVLTHKMVYTTTVKAPIEKVWAALTQPEWVKQYFFGTDLITNWEIGQAVVFKGEWEGQGYEDRGVVLEFVPEKRLAFSYLSNWSGKEDLPENHLWVCYEVNALGNETVLTIEQTNYDEERATHSKENWASLVNEMRKLLE